MSMKTLRCGGADTTHSQPDIRRWTISTSSGPFTSGKDLVPMVQEAGFELQTIQSVTSRSTDCDILVAILI
jgi:hypothetical protein